MRRRRARGFTLIELMVTVGLASIVGTTFFGVVYMQSLGYLQRLDEYDAHQNARAGINTIRRYVQVAGWGLAQDANAVGTVVLGTCLDSANPTVAATACNNVPGDGGSDRLRALSLVGDSEFVGAPAYASGNTCGTNTADDVRLLHSAVAGVRPITPGTLVGIGGRCAAPSAVGAASDVAVVGSDSPGGGCAHRYTFNLLSTGGTGLTCPSGYDTGFGFGRALMVDFFVARGGDGKWALYMSTNPQKAAQVVAFGVEDMQVRYGLDASVPPDGRLDMWCDDPRPPSAGGGCAMVSVPVGTSFSAQQHYNRIVALQVALRVSTDSTRPQARPVPLDPAWTAAKPIANAADGYRRWLYTTTINLRNNHIE